MNFIHSRNLFQHSYIMDMFFLSTYSIECRHPAEKHVKYTNHVHTFLMEKS